MGQPLISVVMLKTATVHQVEPTGIGLVHALRVLISFVPGLAVEPIWKLPDIYRENMGLSLD